MAQELLQTFGTDLGGVKLAPNDKGGVFKIKVGAHLVWDRTRDGGFTDVKTLKTRVRDVIAPNRDLGHLESANI